MLLREKVSVAPRFQRAIRIDTDFGIVSALEGFICPESSKQSLDQICSHIETTQQAAFTWTGPYGCGKSSLALAFGSILDGPSKRRNSNAKYLAKDLVKRIWNTLPPKSKGWHVLPIVGRREMPHKVIAEKLIRLKLFNFKKDIDQLTEEEVLTSLLQICEQNTQYGGVLLLLDEMGKYLEHSAEHHQDIYFFQQLAELASRSNKKLIVVGILHQSFEEYAGSLTKYFRQTKENFTGLSYLTSNEVKDAEIKNQIIKLGSKSKIGISWKSVVNIYGKLKSLQIKDFEPIFSKNRTVINVQYGEVLDEINRANKKGIDIFTFKEIDLFNDFDSCMSILKNLDVFVTVSNSTAHISGA